MKKELAAPRRGSGDSTDWEGIRRRLEQAEQAVAQAAAPSAEERRSVLKARARALAKEAPAALDRQQSLEIIEFRLAAETYGIESAFVREVYPLKDFSPLPGTPPFVLGVINVRGEILSVVDLKKFFSLPEKGLGEMNKVVIIRDQRMEYGILADAVLGARSLSLEEINPAPPTITGIGAAYLKGVTSERVVILDAQRILGDEKIVVHQEAE
ncbi:MAG: purine-binding chemotaxis protein CheW [Desulfarculus sp.]|nr:MAG: purine-binding chemotaxis protein CheW [Desulfarculus sp.]